MNVSNKCQMKLEQIVDYLAGGLDSAQLRRMKTHLDSGCDSCETWVTSIREMAAEQPVAAKRPMLAQPLLDTRMQPQLAGVRGGATLTRRRVYEAENKVCVDIQQHYSDEGVELEGQIIIRGGDLDEVSGTVVTLSREGQPVATSEADFLGDFQMSNIEPGVYDLDITTPSMSVTLRGFDVD